MRILLVPFCGGIGLGPLTRCLAVAEEGKKRGHQIAFLCKPFFRRITESLGFKTFVAPDTAHLKKRLPKYRLADIAVEYGLTDINYLKRAVKKELAVIASFRPDIIFTETQFSLNFSAAAGGVPWATAASWTDHPGFRSPLYNSVSVYPKELKQVNLLAFQYGLKPFNDLCDLAFSRADLKIAPTSPELQPELLSVPDIYFVGPLASKTLGGSSHLKRLALEKTWPTVYVYLSPGEIPASSWIRIISGTFSNQPYNAIVLLAPLKKIPRSLPRLANVHWLGLAPAQKLLRQADIVITHGGGNTIVDALANGKPLLVFPADYAERDYNGRAVERLGAGLNLTTGNFTPPTIRRLVRRLTRDKSFADRAKMLGKKLIRLGGVKKTLDLLEARGGQK